VGDPRADRAHRHQVRLRGRAPWRLHGNTLTSVFYGEITTDSDRVKQLNFHNYRTKRAWPGVGQSAR